MKRKWIGMIAFLLVTSVFAGCSGKAELLTQHEAVEHSEVIERAASDSELQDERSTELQSEESIDFYNEILKYASQGDVEFTFKTYREDELGKAYLRVVSDHPELFWLGSGYSYKTVTDNSGMTVTFECVHMSLQDIAEKRAEFDSVVAEIVKEANSRETLYDKVIFIHDYIIDHTQYDQETYKLMNESRDSQEIFEATTAYGCLVNKKAVCSGYSAAFQLLMQQLGIPSGRVTGRKTDGDTHEWNYILLDDEYYFVDVTWDDPISEGEDHKTYEFLCITTDELKETHEIDGDQFVPECSAKKYDYYIYHNLYLDHYDFESFKAIFINGNSDTVSAKFSDAQERKNAIKDLIEEQKIYSIAEGKHSCAYSLGASDRVLTITLQ